MNISVKSFLSPAVCVATAITALLGFAGGFVVGHLTQETSHTAASALPLKEPAHPVDPFMNPKSKTDGTGYVTQEIKLYSPLKTLYPEGVIKMVPSITASHGTITCTKGVVSVPLRLDGTITLWRRAVVNHVESDGWSISAPESRLGRMVAVLIVNGNRITELPYEFNGAPATGYRLQSKDWGPITSVTACLRG